MTPSPKFSGPSTPRRRRARTHVRECLALDAVDLAPILRTSAEVLRLSWIGTSMEISFRRDDGGLVVLDGPKQMRIELSPVTIAHGRRWYMLLCPACTTRRRRLYLPWCTGTWACRTCHKLTSGAQRGAPFEHLVRQWERLGRDIEKVRNVRRLGDRPAQVQRGESSDRPADPRDLQREIAAARKAITRLAPPGLLEGIP